MAGPTVVLWLCVWWQVPQVCAPKALAACLSLHMAAHEQHTHIQHQAPGQKQPTSNHLEAALKASLLPAMLCTAGKVHTQLPIHKLQSLHGILFQTSK